MLDRCSTHGLVPAGGGPVDGGSDHDDIAELVLIGRFDLTGKCRVGETRLRDWLALLPVPSSYWNYVWVVLKNCISGCGGVGILD